ncbi:MAG: hypothetical protein IT384_06235 [Deltaproteobacteria bacterium]|nr:hypothetical protein [Deltaproteobacteria bacterium]
MSLSSAGVLLGSLALFGESGLGYDAGASFGFDSNVNAATEASLAQDALRLDLWAGLGPWFELSEDWEVDLFGDVGRSQLFDDADLSSTDLGAQAGLSWWAGDRTVLRLVPRGGFRFFGDSTRNGPSASVSMSLRQGLYGPLWGEVSGRASLRRAQDELFDEEGAAAGARLRMHLLDARLIFWGGYAFDFGTYALVTPEAAPASGSGRGRASRAIASGTVLVSESVQSHSVSVEAEARFFDPIVIGAGWVLSIADAGSADPYLSQSLFLAVSVRGG